MAIGFKGDYIRIAIVLQSPDVYPRRPPHPVTPTRIVPSDASSPLIQVQ